MTQSQVTPNAREALTETIIDAKVRKNLTFEAISEGTGLSVAYTTAALLGQHALPENAAKLVGERLGLDADAVRLLQTIPVRGSIPGGVPTDPTIYRFYEMVQVYGSTLKALVHEKFGDGIISALQVLQAVVRSGRSVAELLDGVTLFPQVLINVRLRADQDWKANAKLAAEQEAVKAELAETGRLLIRPSGTEPLLRVMVEARDAALAERCAQRLAEAARAG